VDTLLDEGAGDRYVSVASRKIKMGRRARRSGCPVRHVGRGPALVLSLGPRRAFRTLQNDRLATVVDVARVGSDQAVRAHA
jgi:hypothetical protein